MEIEGDDQHGVDVQVCDTAPHIHYYISIPYLTVDPSICLSVCLCVCLPACLSVCPPVSLGGPPPTRAQARDGGWRFPHGHLPSNCKVSTHTHTHTHTYLLYLSLAFLFQKSVSYMYSSCLLQPFHLFSNYSSYLKSTSYRPEDAYNWLKNWGDQG